MDLFILFLVVATIGMLAVVAWSAIQNRMQPVRQVRAIVLRRRTRDDSLDAPVNPLYMLINVFGWGPGRRHTRISNNNLGRLSGEATVLEVVNGFITFGVEGGEIELLVPSSIFMSLEDARTGTLVYQGEIFKHFMPDPVEPEQIKRYEPPKGRPLNG